MPNKFIVYRLWPGSRAERMIGVVDTGKTCTKGDPGCGTRRQAAWGSPLLLSTCLAAAVVCILLLPPTSRAQALGQQRSSEVALHRAYQARVDSTMDFFANQVPPDDLTRGGYFQIAANLHRGTNIDWALARLDSLMQHPRGDMFWMFPFLTAMFAGEETLPDDYKARMRDMWRTYRPYRGDTENHWALYYSTLYLVSQEYPGEPGERWFNGKSSAENMAEAEEYLKFWMDLTTTMGQGEYDSPSYIKVYLAPMALLYGWAKDPEMRQRAEMMLDYIIADYAVDAFHGYYAGGHSRVYEREITDQTKSPAARFAWLFTGEMPFIPSGENFMLALSGYRPPAILHHIATDRSAPYIQREKKRTRHRIKHSDVKNAPVYKYMYMRDEYALGSTQGGLLQPIQQQTWGLDWKPDGDPRGKHTSLFTVQPYSSPIEGTMYFAELPNMVTELIVRSKREYDSPTKWTGGSPYEQVFQHEDALIALYDIAPGNRFPHITGFFSKDLARREQDDSGWIFARGGDALIAYYPLAPYEWREEDTGDWRLHSPHLKNGAVVQVAPASDYASFEAFKAAVRALPLDTATEPMPSVTFTTLRGAELVATYGEPPVVDGTPVDYANWPLFEGPFLNADVGSRRLEMRYGKMRRTLDFNTLTITDSIEE